MPRDIQLPDGRLITLTGNETPEQLSALKQKLSTEFAPQDAVVEKRGGRATPLSLIAPLAEGATIGLAPKIAAGLGALPAKGALEAVELATGREAPSLGELYRSGVDIYGGVGEEARETFPKSALAAELGGALAGGVGLAGTRAVKALGTIAGRGGRAGRVGAGAGAGELTQRVYEAGAAPVGEEAEILGREGLSLGGVLGGAIPLAGAAGSALKKTLTPRIKETAQRTIDLAKKYDIPLGLDDLTDSDFYKYLISEGQNLPFSGAGSTAENQLKKFTKAVAKTIGLEDVDRLTPQNMDKAFTEVGEKFDKLTKGKTFSITDDALDGISALEEGVNGGVYGEQGARLFKNFSDDLIANTKDNALSGDQLSKLRNKFARISRTGTNVDAKALAKDFENILIDMIGEDAPEALRKAKYQYKNLIAIEPLAAKAQVDGFISPALVNNRVSQVYRRQHVRGKAGALGDLAEIGQAIKQTIPQSGTAPRQAIRELGTTGAALGAGFINPAIPIAYAGGKAAQVLGNIALQGRNVNPEVIEALMQTQGRLPATISATPALGSGILSGQAVGALQ